MGEKGVVVQRQNFGAKLTPGTLLTFLLVYYSHDLLLERPLYIGYIISTILATLIGHGLLKFNRKK